jgi:hypothetical protein
MCEMIKIVLIFIALLTCSRVNTTASNTNILTPVTNPATGVTIHKRTSYFIDIEAPIELVWIGCTTADPKKSVSLLGADLADGDIVYSFIPRRALYDVPMCLAEEKKYQDMMKGAKTARLVGTAINTKPRPNIPPEKPYIDQRSPKRISDKPLEVVVFFERLQVGDKCRAYFLDNCDLPKNYWAGTIPMK